MSEELYMPIKEGQIVSLGDSRIERVRGRLAILIRVVDLEYSELYYYSSLHC